MERNSQSFAQWLRQSDDPVAALLRRAATSAVGTYGAYVAYGLAHPGLRETEHGQESIEPLPGDELVETPDSAKTFAIDIAAPPEAVWPYLVQMGYGRAGWYGWYPMENGGRGSADGVLPQWQGLRVGDLIPDGPEASQGLGVWRVVELVKPATMLLFSRRVATTGQEVDDARPVDDPTIECSWAFVVRPTATGSRLIVRVRARYLSMGDSPVGRAFRRLFDVGDTVMERTMLQGIQRRAERDAAADGSDRTH